MSCTDMVTGVAELADAVALRVESLRAEGRRAAAQWEGLGRVGGQRADHAASLLRDVRRQLRDIEAFAARCGAQMDAATADPFGG